MITWASHQDGLCLGELAGSVRQGASYVGSYGSSLQASRSLSLLPQESVLQVRKLCARSLGSRALNRYKVVESTAARCRGWGPGRALVLWDRWCGKGWWMRAGVAA